MTLTSPVPIAITSAALIILLQLLRTRRMREKYASAWAILGVFIIVLAFFPSVLASLAHALGIAAPVNLLFFASLVVLYVVCIQASVELSSLGEDRRTLVEEVAMLHLEVEQLSVRLEDLAATHELRADDVQPTSNDEHA